MRKKILIGSAIGLVVLTTCGLFALRWNIVGGIDRAVAIAQDRHPAGPDEADEVSALLALVEDADADLKDRNLAVWALGQLRDERALPILERHVHGGDCDHAHHLCQHELDKAIKLCGDGGLDLLAISQR